MGGFCSRRHHDDDDNDEELDDAIFARMVGLVGLMASGPSGELEEPTPEEPTPEPISPLSVRGNVCPAWGASFLAGQERLRQRGLHSSSELYK